MAKKRKRKGTRDQETARSKNDEFFHNRTSFYSGKFPREMFPDFLPDQSPALDGKLEKCRATFALQQVLMRLQTVQEKARTVLEEYLKEVKAEELPLPSDWEGVRLELQDNGLAVFFRRTADGPQEAQFIGYLTHDFPDKGIPYQILDADAALRSAVQLEEATRSAVQEEETVNCQGWFQAMVEMFDLGKLHTKLGVNPLGPDLAARRRSVAELDSGREQENKKKTQETTHENEAIERRAREIVVECVQRGERGLTVARVKALLSIEGWAPSRVKRAFRSLGLTKPRIREWEHIANLEANPEVHTGPARP